jgi:hypothetical protein
MEYLAEYEQLKALLRLSPILHLFCLLARTSG